MQRSLVVNGVGMTVLTPITKMMSALPLAFLDHAPQNALVICFGMGTTHRSMLSWGISSTAVELVPSVPRFFWYFHADGAQVLASPRSHVVLDDGRRFLAGTTEQFDVIALDPPPPPEAAASSLLYSSEFYSLCKQRLRSRGILQQWLPGSADIPTQASVARALKESFPYVRSFIAHDRGLWGFHFLASQQPIPNRSAAELASRMPATAAADLIERAVSDGFGDMLGFDPCAAFDVGDGARDFQDAVVSADAESLLGHSALEEAFTGRRRDHSRRIL